MPECVNFVEWELYTFFQKIRVVKNIPQANPKNSNKEHLLMTSLLDLFILNTSLRRVDLTGGVYLFLMICMYTILWCQKNKERWTLFFSIFFLI